MNNKIIIAIVGILIAVCLFAGIGMNLKGGNSEEETTSSVQAITQTEKGTDSTEISETKKEAESTVSVSKTTKKTEERQTKPSSKQEKQTRGYINTTKAKKKPSPPEKESPAKTTSAKTEKETQAQISVELSVNCEKAVAYGADYPKYLMSKTKCSVKKGTTVFDLLSEACSKKGLAVVHQNKSYIVSIGGLSEKDCGGSSGWLYTVNGVKPMMSASKYVLKDGDTVEWYYVTSPTD